jgi:hypothetical protein
MPGGNVRGSSGLLGTPASVSDALPAGAGTVDNSGACASAPRCVTADWHAVACGTVQRAIHSGHVRMRRGSKCGLFSMQKRLARPLPIANREKTTDRSVYPGLVVDARSAPEDTLSHGSARTFGRSIVASTRSSPTRLPCLNTIEGCSEGWLEARSWESDYENDEVTLCPEVCAAVKADSAAHVVVAAYCWLLP